MAEFQTVCRVEDVVEGEGRTVEVGNKLVAVFREQGQYYAIDDVCPHMGASLSGGYLERGIVTCPWHAWRFRLADGAWADNPRIKIGCYPVRVVDGEIQVQVPDQTA
jgi:nitrite reductase (NADH) small subunit/3-phenylpropionate/trans-cinnamate dioxygenase ferredoxin subunit